MSLRKNDHKSMLVIYTMNKHTQINTVILQPNLTRDPQFMLRQTCWWLLTLFYVLCLH